MWTSLVKEILRIKREPNCLADTDIGKIIVTDDKKLTIEKKSAIIPTFKYSFPQNIPFGKKSFSFQRICFVFTQD